MNLSPSLLIKSKLRRNAFGIGPFIFLVIFSGVFIGGGLLFAESTKINPNWHQTSGTVVDASKLTSGGKSLYAPVVAYTVDGKEYRATTSSSSTAYPTMGQAREVAYNPDHPNHATVVADTGTNMFIWLFPTIGVAVLAIAIIAFVSSIKRSRAINRLIKYGQKQTGVLIGYGVVSSDRRSPDQYVITVAAIDVSGATQNYVSDTFLGTSGLNAADFTNNPIPIDVYVDITNPQNYYVDISDIPTLTPQRIQELLQKSVTSATSPQPSAPNIDQSSQQKTAERD